MAIMQAVQKERAPARLIERCLARDERAWAELVLVLDPVITRCLVRQLGPSHAHALDDLRMDVLESLVARNMLTLRVFRSRTMDELRAWIHCVARNHAANLHRRNRRGRAVAAAQAGPAPLFAAVAALDCALDAKRAVERAERRPRQVGAIARLHASGYSILEISARAGVSGSTVTRTLRDWRAAAEA